MATPWSLGLLDLDTLELRRQLARLPGKGFHLDYEGLKMDRSSEVTPVQEVCRKLWRPTPPLQHLTRPLQRWPRVLRKSARWALPLLDLDTLGLELRRQRASLPNKIISRAWRAPETGSPSKTFSHGWMQEVCRMALALPPLQHELLTYVFDLLVLRPSRSLQPCPRPLLVPAPSVPRLFRLLPPSLVLLISRVKTPHVIFAAPIQQMKYSVSLWTLLNILT